MGGKVFDGVRLMKEDYQPIATKMEEIFIGGVVVDSYRDKESFGDLDYLVIKGGPYSDINEVVRRFEERLLYKVTDVVVNGDVTSFGLSLPQGVFQVDFLYVPLDSYDFAYNYHGKGDLGNLLGRVARSCGVKLGDTGLYYTQRAPDNPAIILEEYLLTRAWDEALEFLGYDSFEYYKGFDTLENVFDFVMSSDYYTYEAFDLALRNNKSRKRDSKRPNYMAFLDYAKQSDKGAVRVGSSLNRIFTHFPTLKEDFDHNTEQYLKQGEYKKRFNGDVVSDITGLKGERLGRFLSFSTSYFYQDYMLSWSNKELENEILTVFEDWVNWEAL